MRKIAAFVACALAVGFVIGRISGCAGPAGSPKDTTAPPGATQVPAIAAAGSAAQPAPQAQVSRQTLAASAPAAAAPRSTVAAVVPSVQNPPAQRAAAPAQPPRAQPAAATAPAAGDAQIRQARQLVQQGKRNEARKLLTSVYLSGGPQLRQEALKTLNEINAELVFDPRCTAGATTHVVQRGDTLERIGKQYDVNWRLIQRLNGIPPDRIRINQPLKVLTGPRAIMVDKSDFRLALFIDAAFIKEYKVGLGKDNCTPAMDFVVDEMMIEPDWYPPGGGVVKYGQPGHLIGDRWIGLADKPGAFGLGIHGTNEPQTIGTLCSNGCIRMTNDDVKELYDFVTAGTPVRIVE